jgi:formylglycine-generating enzyme required for sulfatase activity
MTAGNLSFLKIVGGHRPPLQFLLFFLFLAPLAAAQTPPAPGTQRRNSKDGQLYVWVPPGTFQMGCSPGDKECYEDERPVHIVQLSGGFWMGQTEVTVTAYQAFSKATGIAVSPGQKGSGYPVTGVIWNEADAYCASAGGRLPTEAEWEFAARGGTTAIRYGDLDAIAWTSANSENMLHEVGQKQPNAYGLFDMLGNLWEWTRDWYRATYYEQGRSMDPPGPPLSDSLVSKDTGAQNPLKTIRGGAWSGFPAVARASYRYWFVPTLRVANIGFRCVLKN